MALTISASLEDKGFQAMKAMVDPASVKKQTMAGMRYASNGVARTLAKEIGARYAIPAGRIKQDIRKPTYTENGIQVRFSTKAPSLRAFSGKPLAQKQSRRGGIVSRGISYKVFKGTAEKRQDVFWFIPSGTSVDRPGLPFRRLGRGRTNIQAQYGPSIGRIVTGESRFGKVIIDATLTQTMAQVLKGIERERARQARMK